MKTSTSSQQSATVLWQQHHGHHLSDAEGGGGSGIRRRRKEKQHKGCSNTEVTPAATRPRLHGGGHPSGRQVQRQPDIWRRRRRRSKERNLLVLAAGPQFAPWTVNYEVTCDWLRVKKHSGNQKLIGSSLKLQQGNSADMQPSSERLVSPRLGLSVTAVMTARQCS